MNNRPNTRTDDFYAARLLRQYERSDRAPWPLILVLYVALALIGWAAVTTPDEDFTDSGVGCSDDCLQIQDEADELVSQERN